MVHIRAVCGDRVGDKRVGNGVGPNKPNQGDVVLNDQNPTRAVAELPMTGRPLS